MSDLFENAHINKKSDKFVFAFNTFCVNLMVVLQELWICFLKFGNIIHTGDQATGITNTHILTGDSCLQIMFSWLYVLHFPRTGNEFS